MCIVISYRGELPLENSWSRFLEYMLPLTNLKIPFTRSIILKNIKYLSSPERSKIIVSCEVTPNLSTVTLLNYIRVYGKVGWWLSVRSNCGVGSASDCPIIAVYAFRLYDSKIWQLTTDDVSMLWMSGHWPQCDFGETWGQKLIRNSGIRRGNYVTK